MLGFFQAKRKYKEVAEEKNRLTADNQELQQKYSQKAAYVTIYAFLRCR
jgi:hypothetical protein